MLELDAVGCLLHGAKAALLVGDPKQLPPFTRWMGAQSTGYDVSLMQRWYRSRSFPSFMLKVHVHVYMQHPIRIRG